MNITQQQEFRYQFAGMAMQALILAVELNKDRENECFPEQHELSGYAIDLCNIDVMGEDALEVIQEGIARVSVSVADALIAELEGKDKP